MTFVPPRSGARTRAGPSGTRPAVKPATWEKAPPPIPELLTERETFELPRLEQISYEHLVTEDDTPVDNIFSEKQQRLLTESLYTSWAGPIKDGKRRPFLALANVGLFYAVHRPPLVPDVMLSLDVQAPADPWPKSNRSYFIWKYGKPPEVVIEIVSNREGGEADRKLRIYAHIGVPYYVIHDPMEQLSNNLLRLYELRGAAYTEMTERWLPEVSLGLTLWKGVYADMEATWLRWYGQNGEIIAVGTERVEQERQRAEQERQRAERLAVQLQALGVEPEV